MFSPFLFCMEIFQNDLKVVFYFAFLFYFVLLYIYTKETTTEGELAF